jgi:hypothetical protein
VLSDSKRILATIKTPTVMAVDRWRIELPFRALIGHGYDAWVSNPSSLPAFQNGKIIRALVQPRVAIDKKKGVNLIRRELNSTDTRWIIDLDDRMDNLPDHNIYKAMNPPWFWTEQVLAACDGATVSTDALARWLRLEVGVKCPIKVLPNRVIPGLFKRIDHDPLTVGLIGGQAHVIDWRVVAPAIQTCVDKFPDVRFLVIGPDVDLNGPNICREPYQTWGGYLHWMGQVDIGLCPLTPSIFNQGKSPLKWIEWGSIGVPCVVSSTVFSDYVQDNHDALIASTLADWTDSLSFLIESGDERERIGLNAQAVIQSLYTENQHTTHERYVFYTDDKGFKPWKLEESSAELPSELPLSPSSV